MWNVVEPLYILAFSVSHSALVYIHSLVPSHSNPLAKDVGDLVFFTQTPFRLKYQMAALLQMTVKWVISICYVTKVHCQWWSLFSFEVIEF